jgi:Holliday junction resolvasome RuvABC endonuclease subunit
VVNVLGIDPSLSATGWARGTELGTISEGVGDDRLQNTYSVIARLVTGVRCHLAVLEDLPANAKSAGLTGKMQGVVRLALMHNHVPYIAVSPATLKTLATGRGNCGKADVRMAIYKRTGLDIDDDNQADAWVLHQIGLQLTGAAEALELPASHLRALRDVKLPATFEAPRSNR